MCRCGCGTAFVSKQALRKLDRMRDRLGMPVYLNSACRCPVHNRRVGGAPLSQHRSTRFRPSTAFDVRLYPGLKREDVIKAAIAVGFKGIGASYRTFVHVDDRPYKARW